MTSLGVAVGVAYLHWTHTDMIRDVDRHTVLRELRAHMPAPARRVYPVDQVAAWIEHGVERRRATVYAPPWLRLAQVGRPLHPVLVDLLSRRELPRLMRGHTLDQTGLLGHGGRVEERSLGLSGTERGRDGREDAGP